MTNIITRYFESTDKAFDAVHELVHYHRLSPQIMDVYEQADGLADRLTKQGANGDTAAAYVEKLGAGGAVLLVRAGKRPLGRCKDHAQCARSDGCSRYGRARRRGCPP